VSKSNIIQVFEYEKLKYSTTGFFQEKHFNTLVLFNEKHNNKYFTPIYKGIQFNHYVGVIQVAGLTIEILPKADKEKDKKQEDKDVWQGVLLNMLRVCKKIQVDNVSEASLKKRYNSILEVYYEMYVKELEQLVKNGLIKKYKRIESNQLALKGRLMFSKHVQNNVIHKERFYTEHQVYNHNHLLHQTLYKGLRVLETLTNGRLSDRIKCLSLNFNEFDKKEITQTHFSKLTLNRKTTPYTKALNIAKMLILNYSPSLNSGQDNMLTLLFNMNLLWEEYIYRVLNKYKPEGYIVSYQNMKKFWESKVIKPDIVIKDNNENTYIIDTKWKVIEATKPSDNDLKQIFAYNLRWQAEKSMLLYPKTNQVDSKFGEYHYTSNDKSENKCKLGFISIVKGNTKVEDEVIADKVFLKFEL
jgi:5-methylcytosine-specific restriction enzyme subunit McrC